MKKAVLVFCLISAIITGAHANAQYVSDALPSYDNEDKVTFIVEMEESPVLSEIQLPQDSASYMKTEKAQRYRNALLRSHKETADTISLELSEDIKPQYTYTELFNGFAIEAEYKDLEAIRGTDGVKAVYVSSRRKADFRMRNASAMTHSLSSDTSGYTGSGQVIAILDSEFDVKHIAFSNSPQNPKYTKQDISSILSDAAFNASDDVNRVYESVKIPFRYDYGDDDADTYSTDYVHGTQVAGIAAGNCPDGDFYGVAPDAQLVLMKIADSDGYTSDAAIVAAMDDAAKLGVCAINCSFGFDYEAADAFNPAVTSCYTNAYNSGIFVSVAAGNSSRGFFGVPSETIHIDDSATGMPNGLDTAVSVASVDNSLLYFDVSEITLWDGSVLDAAEIYADTGFESLVSHEYVYCKTGYPDDFELADVQGKIAVVDRGTLTFAQKSNNAKAAGAVGIIIINNEDKYFTSSKLSLPAVCIKSSSGRLLKDAEVNGISSMTPFTLKSVENDAVIDDYSSYGVTEALSLKPDISAPGGNIYSSVPGDKYQTSGGTSMSAPHISGIVAIISQYLEDTGRTPDISRRADLIGNLIMSTADVVYMSSSEGDDRLPYSPRVQGAGMANTANAIKTPVILYAEGGKTKLELGDNLTETVEISFTAQNLTENDAVYDKISAVTLTDGYVLEDGTNYISDAVPLKSELILASDSVTVPANSSVTVSAQLLLDTDELYENSLIFPNGFYIDGFIRMEDTTDDIVSVGIPFMGFYGNWTKAPVFDSTMYDEGGSTLIYEDAGILGTFLYSNYDEESIILGYNSISDTYTYDTIAISPDGDGYSDMLGLYLTPMRSVRDLKITITDEDERIFYVQDEAEAISKFIPYDTLIEIPDSISDGTYLVTIDGYMNYNTENSLEHSISIPLRVDRQKPLVKGCRLDGATLTLDIYDNAGISYVSLTDAVTGEKYDKAYDVCITEDKIIYTFKDNTAPDLSNIMVEISDNAMNYASYFLGGFGGKIGAYISDISAKEKSYTITFELACNDEFSTVSLILAFYDEKGKLIHTDTMQDKSVSSGELEFTGAFDASTADKCKLFIWYDTKGFMPLDTAKVFDIKMYDINGEMS